MTDIALTGAAGNVGRVVRDAFGDDHAVTAFTHSEHDDVESELLDVTDADEVAAKLDGFDVVLHLAGVSSPEADWESVSEVNVQGTKHVLDAAVENDIDRVVFASSNHAVGTYNADARHTEQMTLGVAEAVSGDAQTSPDSFYGVSKAACENLTNFYANRHGLEVVNLRIGWYLTEEDLRSTVAEADPERAAFARATWLGPRDCREVHRTAVTADLSESPVTLNAVSRNDDRFHTLTETMQHLGYEPRENAAEVLDG
ncbi:NAD-dependent epimerase/dehydratase family protein [Halogeometricum limi]|uniref:NAD dependent epimerase/dehydratase family protein n=1 Tax=Halogeometricum limi TaxID=555875 RepID=A0A1I6H6N7_9EURY|nr:NAD(P)-dependent oxidoreductase [Halogeometricum limi]SFR50119.1 NAD dependent epimerase/dehydratase family protein [Halogeometricum limi]